MADLLLELYSEEIPAGMQVGAAEDLARQVNDALVEAGYLTEAHRTFVTPQRIALSVIGLPLEQKDQVEERKGPRVDAPEKALNGFLKSTGLSKDDLHVSEDKKGAFYVAKIERKGRATVDVLSDLLPEAITRVKWPKSMRWGANSLRWVRPLHNVLCIFDGEVVPFKIDHLESNDKTRGHRFHSSAEFRVKDVDDYIASLNARHVVVDRDDRIRMIEADANTQVFAESLELIDDQHLLAENAGLVEWPVVLVGQIDDLFVRPITEGGLPPEVLTSAMRKHQKYFTVRNPKTDSLAPRFVVVSNIEASDGGKEVVSGNERVLRARLSDAKFFWDNDRKRSLESRVGALSDIVFHAKLGSVHDKVKRIAAIAEFVGHRIDASIPEIGRAALLCKADLVTQMVGEFADLQGLMGKYYADHDGEPQDVAAAIEEHYAPLGPNDACPAAPTSIAVAIADKIDTLVGFFGIDEQPTGSKDPFALRRAALGVIRIILDNQLRLPLNLLMAEAAKQYKHQLDLSVSEQHQAELLQFFVDRLKVHLRDAGAPYDLIDAVFALPNQDDLLVIDRRVRALKAFLDSEDGANLLTAYKRASSILRIEEKKDKSQYAGIPDPKLFTMNEEKALHKAIQGSVERSQKLVVSEDFRGAMGEMSALRKPVDAFFDEVTVNADESDLRENRLYLLSQIRQALESVADFSKVKG